MAKRDRLGRGLAALIGEATAEKPKEGASTNTVAVGAIAPNPFQPRREFAEQELADLAASIAANGLLQPIVVRPAGPGSSASWELIAGERRWRAVTRLGWKEVPAVIKDVDDRTLLVLALVENLQRAQLNALEEAEGYKRLGDEFTLTHQQIAEVMGRDRSTVANSLRLLQLPFSVRQLLADGRLSAGHARALLGMANEERMIDLAQQTVANDWSVRDLESAVKQARPARKPKAQSAERPRDVNEKLLEEELQQTFGTQVRIKLGRGMKGTIEIPFLDADDFDRVFEMLARRPVTEIVS